MIRIQNLVKRYPGAKVSENAVNGISLNIAEGEFVTLLGPSGCGKTTTLRMIAGLEEPTDGEISFGDEIVFSRPRGVNIPVNRRPIGMVFQSYAIWPHMSVFENVSFPLRMRPEGMNRRTIRLKTEQALRAVGLGEYIYRPSTALSGGQQQRVALARALVREPKIMLLDEPLSNLDAKLRDQMRDEIREIQERTGITMVFVTHDQSEALGISDRIVVMNRGNIVEDGAPRTIYTEPQRGFTADFIGASNTIEGIVAGVEPELRVETPFGCISCAGDGAMKVGEEVVAFVRPEAFGLLPSENGKAEWQGVVEKFSYQGDFTNYSVEVAGRIIRVRVYEGSHTFGKGERVSLQVNKILFRPRRDVLEGAEDGQVPSPEENPGRLKEVNMSVDA